MKRKLRSRSGEMILEVLIACLIGFFAVLMLSEMIAASSKLIVHGREDMNDYRDVTINFVNTINTDSDENPRIKPGKVVFAYDETIQNPTEANKGFISAVTPDDGIPVKFAASSDGEQRRVVSYWR